MFSEKQKEIIHYDNIASPIYTILEGAVRSGKTFCLMPLWIKHIHSFKNKNVKFIMTGYTIPTLKSNVLDDMSNLFDIDTGLDKNNTFKLFGNTVHCFGTDRVDSYKRMRGLTAYGWLGNEITLSHPNSVDQAIKRCSGEGFRIFWDTNPDHPQHPIKRDYIDLSGEKMNSGRERIKSWHFVLDDNEFLTEDYKESLKKSIPSGMWFDRDILGQWVASEGMIYRDFNFDTNTIEEAPKPETIKEYIAGVDWGYDHPGSIGVYGIDGEGIYYRLYEIVERHKTPDWWLAQAKEIQAKHKGIIFYGDPSRVDVIEMWRKDRLNIRAAHNAVFEGITCVASKYKNNKLFIVRPTNKNHLKEIFDYRWKDSLKEEPIKVGDDSMDTERYGIYSRESELGYKIKASTISAGRLGL